MILPVEFTDVVPIQVPPLYVFKVNEKCSSCGKTLVKTKVHSRKETYFQCTWYVKGRCRSNHYIREDVLLPTLLEQIKKDFSNKLDIKISEFESQSQDNTIKVLKTTLQKLKAKEERFRMAYEDGIDTLEEYKQNRSKIKEQIDSIEQELKKPDYTEKIENKKERIYSLCEDAFTTLSDPNVSEEIKCQISHELFDKIIYDRENGTLLIYYK